MHPHEKHDQRDVDEAHTPDNMPPISTDERRPRWICPKLLVEHRQHSLPKRVEHLREFCLNLCLVYLADIVPLSQSTPFPRASELMLDDSGGGNGWLPRSALRPKTWPPRQPRGHLRPLEAFLLIVLTRRLNFRAQSWLAAVDSRLRTPCLLLLH